MIDEKRFKLIDSKTGKEFEFDGLTGSMGPDVINISSLYKQTGLFTVSYTHLRAHETEADLVCRLLLEKNDLFLKKIGKTVRKIFVNFESKLPIDKIIFFYGISNFKERLLLYLP